MIHVEEVMGRAQRCFAVVRTGLKVGLYVYHLLHYLPSLSGLPYINRTVAC